jgi:hypothetical protein
VNRTNVTSSTVASVGFESASGILEVEFHSGAIYQYFDVPEEHFTAMVDSGSPGGYLNAHIKSSFRYGLL